MRGDGAQTMLFTMELSYFHSKFCQVYFADIFELYKLSFFFSILFYCFLCNLYEQQYPHRSKSLKTIYKFLSLEQNRQNLLLSFFFLLF